MKKLYNVVKFLPNYLFRNLILFVLPSAQSTRNGELDFHPTPEFPALQYLDNVDPGSRADRVGLKPGDFILEVLLLNHFMFQQHVLLCMSIPMHSIFRLHCW